MVAEKTFNPLSGWFPLIVTIALFLTGPFLFITGAIGLGYPGGIAFVLRMVLGVILFLMAFISLFGYMAICDRVADRTGRSDLARHGGGFRVFRLRAARAVVGQSDHRGHGHSDGAATDAASALSSLGQPLQLQPLILHAGSRQREAARGESRQELAATLGHARSASARHGRAEHLPARML